MTPPHQLCLSSKISLWSHILLDPLIAARSYISISFQHCLFLLFFSSIFPFSLPLFLGLPTSFILPSIFPFLFIFLSLFLYLRHIFQQEYLLLPIYFLSLITPSSLVPSSWFPSFSPSLFPRPSALSSLLFSPASVNMFKHGSPTTPGGLQEHSATGDTLEVQSSPFL